MEPAYRIEADSGGWERRHRYRIEAAHFARLPEVACSSCGNTWSQAGLSYPTIKPAPLEDLRHRFPETPSVSVEAWREAMLELETIVGAGRPLRPGTRLGPLVGSAEGEVGDVAWLDPWTPLLKRNVAQEMIRRGVRISGADAFLSFGGTAHETLVEIEARPSADLHSSHHLPMSCRQCGYRHLQLPTRVVVDRYSLDDRQFLQRIRQFPTLLVVCGRNAVVLRELALSNLVMVPLEAR